VVTPTGSRVLPRALTLITTNYPLNGRKENMNTTWDDIETYRMRREDEGVARRWEDYTHLGRGWVETGASRRIEPDYLPEEY
jgi:hypothetical protein